MLYHILINSAKILMLLDRESCYLNKADVFEIFLVLQSMLLSKKLYILSIKLIFLFIIYLYVKQNYQHLDIQSLEV